MTPLTANKHRRGGWSRSEMAQTRRILVVKGWRVLLMDADIRAFDAALRKQGFGRCRQPGLTAGGKTVRISLAWVRPGAQRWCVLEFRRDDWPDWTREQISLTGVPHRRIAPGKYHVKHCAGGFP